MTRIALIAVVIALAMRSFFAALKVLAESAGGDPRLLDADPIFQLGPEEWVRFRHHATLSIATMMLATILAAGAI